MNNYKAASERTDENERLLTPPFRKTRTPEAPQDGDGRIEPMNKFDYGQFASEAPQDLGPFIEHESLIDEAKAHERLRASAEQLAETLREMLAIDFSENSMTETESAIDKAYAALAQWEKTK